MKKPPQSVCVKVLKKNQKKRNVLCYTCSQNEGNSMHGGEQEKEDEQLLKALYLLQARRLKRLKKRAYESMLEHYTKVSPQHNEPPYARSVLPKAG